MEIWKDIPGYEGLYQASNLGRIKSFKREVEKILKASPNTKGYLQLSLWKDNKKQIFRAHRLILLTFVGYNALECNHKDGNKFNNRIDNLEYCTSEYNLEHKVKNGLLGRGNKIPHNKLSIKQVIEIKRRLLLGESYWNIHKDYPVTAGTIWAIKEKRTFSYVNVEKEL